MIEKKKKIHTRKIDIATYEGSEDTVIVEGVLEDERLLESYRLDGAVQAPGTVHHMIIRLEVRGPQLVVEDIEVEMPTVPLEICRETLHCLEKVKGMSIVSGFTRKVKTLAGGPKGCIHLLTLLTAMAPAAVQGATSAVESRPHDPETDISAFVERFKNTCRVWREDGPLMEKLRNL